MTSPIIHARSSVQRCGGDPATHMILHQALDASKIAYCDARHRAVYHHVEGVEYLSKLMSDNAGDELLLNAVGVQHLREDLGGNVASASDWAHLIDLNLAPSITTPYSAAEAFILHRYRGCHDDYADIFQWLSEPSSWVGADSFAGIFRHHSFGCFAAEERFGFEVINSIGKPVPVRYIVENWIRRVYGRIPTLSDWCSALPLESWMNRGYQLDSI